MPRKRRILLPGEIAHIMSRGHDGCDIFHSNDDTGHLGITAGAVVHAMKRAQYLSGEKIVKTIK